MRRVLKVLGIALLILVAAVAALIGWMVFRSPNMRPPSTERIEPTPERLARGKYLLHHVADCLGCHSDHIATAYGFPIKPGTEGMGGFTFDEKLDFPGAVSAQNITSDHETGLGAWTDGEILRALREGVNRKGEALFPMMPYENFRSMSDDDARALVAYLRTLPPIRNETPPRKLDFPVNLFIKFTPKPLDGPVTAPDRADTVQYGKYLVAISGCHECHTAHDDKGQLLPGRDFAGGWEMRGPWGRNITPNITPHPDSYVGRATREEFIGRFKAFETFDPMTAPPAQKGRNTIMPWLAFSGMTPEDLGAIYDYLKTVNPIANKVNPFPDAP